MDEFLKTCDARRTLGVCSFDKIRPKEIIAENGAKEKGSGKQNLPKPSFKVYLSFN